MLEQLNNYLFKVIPRNYRATIHKILFNTHKQRVIIGIVLLYGTIIGLFGYALLNQPEEESTAYYPANLVAALRISDEVSVSDNDKLLSFELTLQNSSPNEAINSIDLNLLSTQESLYWEEAVSNEVENVYSIENSAVSLAGLSAGQRSTYTVTASIANTSLDSISILGKLTYTTPQGTLFTDTNREFISLNGFLKEKLPEHLTLTHDFEVYESGQAAILTLSRQGVIIPDIQGKINISNTNNGQVVASENCNLTDIESCEVIVSGLRPGSYSGLFIDEQTTIFSNIIAFEVLGQATGFVPDEEASLTTGFGPSSINGTAYVYAKDVLNQQSLLQTNNQCIFDINRDGELIASTAAPVLEDACVVQIRTEDLSGNGIYTISLRDTDETVDVAFATKTEGLLPLKNTTLLLDQDKPVALEIDSILDDLQEPLDDVKATLHILHYGTGKSEQLRSLDGESLSVQEGSFTTLVPSSYFSDGGLYFAYLQLEDGQQSNTIQLNFNTAEIGHTRSGIIVDNYDSLQIGQPISVRVEGIKDQNSNIVDSGECGLEIYTRRDAVEPLFVSGFVTDGLCQITVDGNLITTSGPALLSLSGKNINTDIDQSRQIFINPGGIDDYGFLSLEYEPARIGYANNLIIGPVSDIYGNATNATGLMVVVSKNDQIIHQVENIATVDGFATTIIPSSIFTGQNQEELTISLLNQQTGETILSRSVLLTEDSSNLVLPYIPTDISSDENIKVEYGGLQATEEFSCSLQYIRSDIDYAFASSTYSLDTDSCEFDYSLDQYRNNPHSLIKLEANGKTFHKMINNTPGEAANLFVITPEVKLDTRDELQLRFHTSPIVDQQGLAVGESSLRFDYNGKVVEVPVISGLATVEAPATLFDSQDLKEIGRDSYLDLDINAKISVLSISQTNTLEVFLNDNLIADSLDSATLVAGQNVITSGELQTFIFETPHCNVITTGAGETTLLTHYQDNICYLQAISAAPGAYTITFEDNGYYTGNYTYVTTAQEAPEVLWCQESPCKLTVFGDFDSVIEATIFDQQREFRFDSEELSNELFLEQNGLNPLKYYPVEVRFTDVEGQEHIIINSILGELLIK